MAEKKMVPVFHRKRGKAAKSVGVPLSGEAISYRVGKTHWIR